MRKYCNKVVLENFFEPSILFLLLKKDSYGYELKTKLENECKCNVNIANLYRCMNTFTEKGYVIKSSRKSLVGPKQFLYTITESGKEYLSSWVEELEIHEQKIKNFIKNYKKIV